MTVEKNVKFKEFVRCTNCLCDFGDFDCDTILYDGCGTVRVFGPNGCVGCGEINFEEVDNG